MVKPKIMLTCISLTLGSAFYYATVVFSRFNIIIYFMAESNATNSFIIYICNLDLIIMGFNKNSESLHYKVQMV